MAELDKAMNQIVIIDFGSQYSHLIARRIRESQVYAQLEPPDISPERLKAINPRGIILSGGPASVYGDGAPHCSPEIFRLGIPVLGVCYGMQLMSHLLDGKVVRSERREYGHALLDFGDNKLVRGLVSPQQVWMSHGDVVEQVPSGFCLVGKTKDGLAGIIVNEAQRLYGIQFHPEVVHTENGITIIRNFLFDICGCTPDWTMDDYHQRITEEIRRTVGDRSVVCGISGGVDSTVLGKLLHEAVGERLRCIFVDNGFLRKNEGEQVYKRLKAGLGLPVELVDASEQFLSALQGVDDPEEKRRRIGQIFVDVFFKTAGNFDFLAQGTLYPDVIESVSTRGPSATIKTHHNRVQAILDLIAQGRVLEPLRELYKDEVRILGERMGLPKEMLWRQPFPGPGLAIRILGPVCREYLDRLREADHILVDEIKRAGLYEKLWQSFAVFLPVRSVGVMGDERTYEQVIAIRAVESKDGMTADWVRLPYEILGRVSNRIINEVKGINRVVYDLSSKPPSTIEWE